jgi:lipoyl(octanoyl) transferase
MKPWLVEELGRRGYAETLELQRALVDRRQRGEVPDTLLLVEHEDVVTLGRRRTSLANVLVGNTMPVVEIERGGDVTYHGPGQLVAYPIVLLEDDERDLHLYLRHLEDGVIATCAELGLTADREPGYTGVWIGGRGLHPERRKLASMGIAVRRWVAYHGLALNVSTDLSKFTALNPCGLEAQVMTSLSRELGRVITLAEVAPRLAHHLGAALGRA